jgi:hypothetical protein
VSDLLDNDIHRDLKNLVYDFIKEFLIQVNKPFTLKDLEEENIIGIIDQIFLYHEFSDFEYSIAEIAITVFMEKVAIFVNKFSSKTKRLRVLVSENPDFIIVECLGDFL